jgi:hypothetical protein
MISKIVREGKADDERDSYLNAKKHLEELKEELKVKDKMNQYIKNCKSCEYFELLDYVGAGSESVIYRISLINKKKPQQKKKCNYEINFITQKK